MARTILALAGAVYALFVPSGATQAQPVHHFVNIATAVLPEEGSPEALVFADTVSAKRTGDMASIQVVYALGEPKTLHGQPTSYVSFGYEIDCVAKTRRVTRYDTHAPDGSVVSATTQEGAIPVAGALDETLLKLACGGTLPDKGFASIEAVLSDAASYESTQRETNSQTKHNFVLAGAANGSALGAFDVFVDTANPRRSGGSVTAFSLDVFQKSIDPAAQPGAYTINTVTYDCSAKTATTSYLIVYRADTTPFQSGPTASGARPIKAGSVEDKALNLVCANLDPGYQVKPSASVAEAVAMAGNNLLSTLRH
jgi:hypothetical protein